MLPCGELLQLKWLQQQQLCCALGTDSESVWWTYPKVEASYRLAKYLKRLSCKRKTTGKPRKNFVKLQSCRPSANLLKTSGNNFLFAAGDWISSAVSLLSLRNCWSSNKSLSTVARRPTLHRHKRLRRSKQASNASCNKQISGVLTAEATDFSWRLYTV